MPRFNLMCLSYIVLFLLLVDVSNTSKLNKSISGSILFPDYPPSTLNLEEQENDNGELKTLKEVEQKVKGIIDEVIKKVLPYVIRASADIRLTGKCMASIFKVVLGMQKLQEWAIRMVDATGKPPSGVFQGTSMSLGDFDECLNVRVGKLGKPPAPGEREYFHGKYCTIAFKLPKGILDAIEEYETVSPAMRYNTSVGTSKSFLNILDIYGPFLKVGAFRLGVCIPSTCDVEDLSSIGSTISRQIGFPVNVLHCQEKKKFELKSDQAIIITILSSITALVLLCTAGEIYFSKCPPDPTSTFQSKLVKVSKSLSAINSTKNLIKIQTDNHPVPMLRGLLLLTIVFNILAHTYIMYNDLFFAKLTSIVNYLTYMKKFYFSIFANGSNGIENYFFIAGFLTTFIRFKKSVTKPKINLPKLLILPYIRMTLLQLLAIGLFLLLPVIGYGPFWGDFVGPSLNICREKWWLNLFYIQNYWDSDDFCLYHTWLLAAVMQLYVVAVLVLWLLIRKPNIAMIVIICLITGGMALVGVVVFTNKFPGALSMYLLDVVSGPKMWNKLFIKTFDHLGPFTIGLVTGYLVAKHIKYLYFGKVQTTVIWCVALASVSAVIVGLYGYRNRDMKMDSSVSILYAMLNRNIYALFIAWFTIACLTGKAGFIPDILSWKVLIPVYRLSFLAYLLHLIIMYYHIGILRERVYASHEENIINYFGYLVSTYILSYICYIFFQVPYMYLESLIVKKTVTGDISDNEENDIEKEFSSTMNNGNKGAITAKSIKSHVHTLTLNGMKENPTLGGLHNNQDKF